jgi:hypothetical protein
MGALDILLASLSEYIRAEADHSAGQIELSILTEAKKRFAKSLNEYVDHRVEASISRRRSQKSQQRIELAESINAAMKSTKMSVQTMRALNSAPPPPDGSDPEAVKEWQKRYEEWYNKAREEGLKVP